MRIQMSTTWLNSITTNACKNEQNYSKDITFNLRIDESIQFWSNFMYKAPATEINCDWQTIMFNSHISDRLNGDRTRAARKMLKNLAMKLTRLHYRSVIYLHFYWIPFSVFIIECKVKCSYFIEALRLVVFSLLVWFVRCLSFNFDWVTKYLWRKERERIPMQMQYEW